MVKPKKHLGQHFLTDAGIAKDITEALSLHQGYTKVLEIGAGTGVLTQFLTQNNHFETYLIDIDKESIQYLRKHYPQLDTKIIEGDFLRLDLKELFEGKIGIIGNFPYNISSQIFFKVIQDKNQVAEVVCMLQKEVAQRICSRHEKKTYGILSVFLQLFYEVEYLFTVKPDVFDPPPKVDSAVIRLKRNELADYPCNEKKFIQLVKQGFNNRRKTLRNALKPLGIPEQIKENKVFDLRAEQLSPSDFVNLTDLWLEAEKNNAEAVEKN